MTLTKVTKYALATSSRLPDYHGVRMMLNVDFFEQNVEGGVFNRTESGGIRLGIEFGLRQR